MRVLWITLALLVSQISIAEDNKPVEENSEEAFSENFKIIKSIPATSVKDQYMTGTCWSFSGLSFIESELIRLGRGEFDLSEMYVVHHTYERKAKRYVRMHGNINFAPGGEFNDVTDIILEYGIVPDEVYNGLLVDDEKHIHSEMDLVLEEYVKAIITNPNKNLSGVWEDGFRKVLESYLGEIPEKFEYNGEKYTPETFAGYLGINASDYIMLSSFTHEPFYESFILEVPDNWSWGEVYNVPLEEFTMIVDSAIRNGYSVAWSSDVSEDGFCFDKGMAIAPEIVYASCASRQKEKWDEKTKKEKEEILFNSKKPVKEIYVDQELRQKAFEDYSTTDDHGMHIVGLAYDKKGNSYYYVKNSWGNDNPFNGYMFVSQPYFQYKTIAVMVHKDAIPKYIFEKIQQ
ncbi:MAG: aminopeptidase [Bacteroidales bacterium]|nr:aminopeptidase [Bacteroidales bacterium]